MENIKTYYDLQNDAENEKKALELFKDLYEKRLTLTDKEIQFIAESLKNGEEINDVEGIEKTMSDVQNEGLIGGILGGITGIAIGDKIGNAICKALGITTGPLYQLMNSKIVTTAILTYLGIKI